jgi:hypothetical protein
MNQLSAEKRCRIVAALVEGNSLRSTCRMTGAAMNTVLKLLADLGRACAEYHDRAIRNVRAENVQADEIWAFCYAKANHLPPDKRGKFGYGDVWTYTGIDADSKLLISWYVGLKDTESTYGFISDLAMRLDDRVQLTTDSFHNYIRAVKDVFGDKVDYAMLSKLYGKPQAYEVPGPERRYSPAGVVSVRKFTIAGAPDPGAISTSYVERQNLTMRMAMRRFTRLTNGFSKKVENHICAVAIHSIHYNFCRVHRTLRTTPAIKAGLADHVWTLGEIVALLDSRNPN